MEILAPAGSPECLEPAVRCGADAVYLGAPRFSARGNAANFDAQALADAVRYCHARGVRVYLALNTLLRDDELPDALALAAEACRLDIDALIVQDIGLIRLLRAAAPRMKLSASTQMSIHTAAGARLCESLGMRRVVLARELSAAEIRAIRAESTIELEAFAHGALWMSVSGQCYFSAMLGGRSGNSGRCAQTCRLPFAAPGGTGHDLSCDATPTACRCPTGWNRCCKRFFRGRASRRGISTGGATGRCSVSASRRMPTRRPLPCLRSCTRCTARNGRGSA